MCSSISQMYVHILAYIKDKFLLFSSVFQKYLFTESIYTFRLYDSLGIGKAIYVVGNK